ncbi:MAG TPA: peroxiredoxin [Candidatus Binatia bacterium]|nr:peroxiredoxin [Candidatus Binatia bacterium]
MAKLAQKVDDFTAPVYQAGKFGKVKLSQFRGKWVVLFFYPKDFTFICPTEIKGFSDREADFKKANAVIIGASVDSLYSHKNWFERDLPMVKFPVIADQTHQVAKIFDVLKENEGIAFRGTFIIDPQGVLRSAMVNDTSAGRSVNETLRVLHALQSGELCPVEWTPGQKTLGKA